MKAALLFFASLLPYLENGFSLQEALSHMAGGNGAISPVSNAILEQMKRGLSFPEAVLERRDLRLPARFRKIVLQSSRTGNSAQSIALIANGLQRSSRMGESTLKAFAYPVCIILLSSLITAFILAWVLPLFVSSSLVSPQLAQDMKRGAVAALMIPFFLGGSLVYIAIVITNRMSADSLSWMTAESLTASGITFDKALEFSKPRMATLSERLPAALLRAAQSSGEYIATCSKIANHYREKFDSRTALISSALESLSLLIAGLSLLLLCLTVFIPLLGSIGEMK